jgi:hypothetical protein
VVSLETLVGLMGHVVSACADAVAPNVLTAMVATEANARATTRANFMFVPSWSRGRRWCREAYGLIIVQVTLQQVTNVPSYEPLQRMKMEVTSKFGPLLKGAKLIETGGGGGI